MSENPFGEGFDMNSLLQQAQQMQASLVAAQEELAQARVEGTAGGLVSVTVSGTGDLVGVDIKAGSFDPADADSLADLGDLVVAAYRDAKAKADAEAAEKMGPLAGGLGGMGGGGLPGGPAGF
ncbi:YbaB/EbfC family nucleoid-associated protein [Nocardioides mangrovicus]|uniref:Nucleoid-associated protein D9V37_19305 n=1 Tax=Nocardioides mangrovicus TaxID=2478913 RepID=A0A3L8NZX0_9ACTN|nr:YbaB/EbfC family nucleoid-associated protein [Nocardioides mangrovicus]RLV48212.1 YbaB/EbfC family nucleoid-associated protein [Nocardioides mangrovicus]